MLKINSKYQILTPSGFQNFDGIQKLTKKCITFICEDGVECKVSVGHKFYINGKVILSDDVNIGDNLYHQDRWYTKVVDIIKHEEEEDVYDLLNVDNGNTFYANNILHHNCEFIGSSNTIIDGDTLRILFGVKKDYEYLSMGGRFRIWEKPEKGAKYVLGVDTSKGVGSDFSVIQVLKILSITPVKMKQVAVWEDNFTDVYTFAEVVNKMSYYYNNAYMMVENNGESSVVANRLWWEYENENLINTGSKNKDLGIRATTVTKPQAVLLMKKLIEDFSVELVDGRTIDQLTDFQDLGNSKFACVNCNDDCISALYWAIFILEQDVFEDTYTFEDKEEDDDVWGVLTDWSDEEQDWSWMNKKGR